MRLENMDQEYQRKTKKDDKSIIEALREEKHMQEKKFTFHVIFLPSQATFLYGLKSIMRILFRNLYCQ